MLPNPNTGIIIVDHGSKRSAANDMLVNVVALFQNSTGTKIVEPAHMELAEPSIATAFDACVAQGATTVVVHPYFLSPGRHSTTDIPNLVSEAASRHPGVRYHVTPPLGLDEKIAQLITERISTCLGNSMTCANCSGTPCVDSRFHATSQNDA